MSTVITKDQVKAVQTLISKRGLREHKADIVKEYSHGRSTSVSGLFFNEAKALISHLKTDSRAKEDEAKVRMKMKIISQAHEMGWQIEGSRKIDMDRLNAWCVKYGNLHMPLDKYPIEALNTLVTQFEKMYSQYLKKI